MSLPWRDEVGVYLSPRRVLLVRMARGLRPKCVGEACLEAEGGSVADWAPALGVLREQLSQAAWRGAGVRVAVADHWVRHAVVPWAPALRTVEEREVFARHVLGQTFGELSPDWRVTVGEGLPGKPCIASAMPAELLAGIGAVVGQGDAPLLSVQPHLVVAYNLWRPRLADSGWFVTLDEGCLAAAQLAPHGWERVHTVRIGADWAAELRRLRTFGRLSVGAAGAQRVFVDAPGWLRSVAGDVREDGLEWLEDERPQRGSLERLSRVKGMYP